MPPYDLSIVFPKLLNLQNGINTNFISSSFHARINGNKGERLRLYGSKTRCFCRINGARPHLFSRLRSGSDFDIMLRIGPDFISEHHFMIKSDPSSAFLTVFSPYSLRQTREPGYFPKPFLIKEMEMITYQRHQN